MLGGGAEIPQAVKSKPALTPSVGFGSTGPIANFWNQHLTLNLSISVLLRYIKKIQEESR